jgi:hypothetical protein
MADGDGEELNPGEAGVVDEHVVTWSRQRGNASLVGDRTTASG